MIRSVWIVWILTTLAGCQDLSQRPDSQPDGLSTETAVVVKGNDAEAVGSEYVWIREHVPGAKVTEQELLVGGKRKFDRLKVELPDGSTRAYYFDISKSLGKPF